jgi:uncharacterized cupin superfamily protein
MPELARTTVSPTDYEPFTGVEVVEGAADAQVHWLWRPDSGHSQFGGIFRSSPGTLRYTLGNDETVHVLEGEVRVELGDGETLELGPGDVVAFPKGTAVTWTMTSPFKELFILTTG